MKITKSSLFTLFCMLSASVWAQLPNPGPRSPDEAKFLFEQAQKEISASQTKAAIRDLERLLARYPRDEHRAQAQELILGLYLTKKNSAAAIQTAKAYLLEDSGSEAAQAVRAQLIEAYFIAGKNTEARATAKELLNQSKTDSTKSRALYTLAKVDAREKKWNEARAKLDALPVPIAASDKDSLLLEIGVRECEENKAPTKKVKQDDPWISYYEGQNICFKALAAGQTNKASDSAYPTWCDAFGKLRNSLNRSSINKFQKSRLQDEFKKTTDIAAQFECEGEKGDGEHR